MTEVFIKDLVVTGVHGVNPDEKVNPQRFKISLRLTIDLQKAGQSDNLDDTLDWSLLRKKVISIVQDNSFNLIERLAHEIATELLKDKRVQGLKLSIEKLDAFETGIPGIELTI
jgi:dihydroneopterin aldolase